MNWNRINVGVITLILVLALNYLFKIWPWFYEWGYLKSVFQAFRIAHDYTLGFLPIPSLYLIAPIFIGFFYYKRSKTRFWLLKSTLACLIWIIVAFYIFWGFNYTQPSLYRHLGMERVEIDSAYISQAYMRQSAKLVKMLENDIPDIRNYENTIRLSQEKLLKEWDIPTVGRVRVRKILSGSLLHIRTSGIYIPHAFEGHVDSGLYSKQHPFTMAHEMAHGYGFTDESVCNFIAYLTCLQTDDPYIQYSAELAYWRYLARYYKYYHSDTWAEKRAMLAPQLLEDLDQIRLHIQKYKDWMPKYRDVIYDQYLKSHGVKAGIKSYDEMIMLIAAYEGMGIKPVFE